MMSRGGRDTFFLHKDANGSVRSITNASGTEVKCYHYDPFGNIVAVTGSDTGNTRNTRRYAGRDWDDETDLVYMVARFYDPRFGRFTSPDPDHTIMSPYTYVLNNPVSLTDPTGHAARCGGAYSIDFSSTTWRLILAGLRQPFKGYHTSYRFGGRFNPFGFTNKLISAPLGGSYKSPRLDFEKKEFESPGGLDPHAGGFIWVQTVLPNEVNLIEPQVFLEATSGNGESVSESLVRWELSQEIVIAAAKWLRAEHPEFARMERVAKKGLASFTYEIDEKLEEYEHKDWVGLDKTHYYYKGGASERQALFVGQVYLYQYWSGYTGMSGVVQQVAIGMLHEIAELYLNATYGFDREAASESGWLAVAYTDAYASLGFFNPCNILRPMGWWRSMYWYNANYSNLPAWQLMIDWHAWNYFQTH